MKANRFFQAAQIILYANFLLTLLGIIANTHGTIYYMIYGYWSGFGMEKYNIPEWPQHLSRIFSIGQLVLVMLVYLFASRLMKSLSQTGRITPEGVSFIGKIYKLLLILAPLKVIAYFFFPNTYLPSIWDHLMNSPLFTRGVGLDGLFMKHFLVMALSNLVNMFSLHLGVMNAVFFAVLLKGIHIFYSENRELKSELEAVI